MTDRIKVKTFSTTTHKLHMQLDKETILKLLCVSDYPIPETATVTVSVPGGGDWSGMDLDIGDDAMLDIRWTEITTEGDT